MAGKKEPVVNEETMVEDKEPVVNEEIMAEKKVAVANDLVRFRIAKGSSDKERGDVFVAVNGKSYLIKRGVTVEMPKEVVEVLENASNQMDYAISYQEMNVNQSVE